MPTKTKPTAKRFTLAKDSKPARIAEADDLLKKLGFKTRGFQILTKGECRFTLEAWL